MKIFPLFHHENIGGGAHWKGLNEALPKSAHNQCFNTEAFPKSAHNQCFNTEAFPKSAHNQCFHKEKKRNRYMDIRSYLWIRCNTIQLVQYQIIKLPKISLAIQMFVNIL